MAGQADRLRYQSNKDWAIRMLGGICAECGNSESLEFDHIGDKKYNLTTVMTSARDVIDAELRECQLLCHTCHAKKTTTSVRTKPNKKTKLTPEEVEDIRGWLALGTSCAELGRTYGVVPSTISAIKHNYNWRE